MVKDEAKWAYWEKHIKSWRTSGLSRNAYCPREGLKPTPFDYWRPLIVSDQADVKVGSNSLVGMRLASKLRRLLIQSRP